MRRYEYYLAGLKGLLAGDPGGKQWAINIIKPRGFL